MRFYDIVYPKYGSMREYLKNKMLEETKGKLEEARGIKCGRINPTLR